VPALVPREELPAAIALNSAQFNTARLLGPMIAGALLSAASAALVFDLNVISFLGIVVVLAVVKVPKAEMAAAHTSGGELVQSGGVKTALRWALLSGAALAVGGVFWVWSLASSSTAMHLLVPEGLRGRAMSVLALATTGPLPLGHLLGGTVAHAFGIRAGVLGSCGALAVFAAWSAWAREPAVDAMQLPPPPPRGFRAAVWEALTAASPRAQVGGP